jgi:hypothetical protein
VDNLSTCEADSHLRRIIWREPMDPAQFKAFCARIAEREAKQKG